MSSEETTAGKENEACNDTNNTDTAENIAAVSENSTDDEVNAEYEDATPLAEEADNGNLFLASLEEITADDIAPKVKKSPKAVAKDLTRFFIMFMCAFVFLMSAWSLIERLIDYKRGDDIYGSIADNIFDADLAGEHAVSPSNRLPQSNPLPDYYTALSLDGTDIDMGETVEHNVKFEQIKSNLNYLKSINPDIYGYIYIDGTNISFPIVQGADNEYYLNRAWNGDFLVVGSIYADCRADRYIENNRNTVFYGHNMMDGNMFNNVMLFRDEEVFNNKLIEIYTFDGIYTYEPFAIFQTVYTYQYFRMEFASDEDFIGFCEEMQSKSEHNKNMTFTGDDKVITLSTCTPSDDASSYYVGRIALHAKLVKVEK